MIEWTWNLKPLSVRDAIAGNLAEELDFRQRRRTAPQFAVPDGPFGTPCPSEGPGNGLAEAAQLREIARRYGFPSP